ncbi:hypothetical protein D3C86_1401370 [compost metagenome]
MAAGVVADLVTFAIGGPDVSKPCLHLFRRLAETDIGTAGLLAGTLIGLGAGLPVHHQRAGEEIGEMRADLLRRRPASFPQRIVARTVEGHDDELLRLLRLFGKCGKGGEKRQGKSGKWAKHQLSVI